MRYAAPQGEWEWESVPQVAQMQSPARDDILLPHLMAPIHHLGPALDTTTICRLLLAAEDGWNYTVQAILDLAGSGCR